MSKAENENEKILCLSVLLSGKIGVRRYFFRAIKYLRDRFGGGGQDEQCGKYYRKCKNGWGEVYGPPKKR